MLKIAEETEAQCTVGKFSAYDLPVTAHDREPLSAIGSPYFPTKGQLPCQLRLMKAMGISKSASSVVTCRSSKEQDIDPPVDDRFGGIDQEDKVASVSLVIEQPRLVIIGKGASLCRHLVDLIVESSRSYS
jgi:hypothetical protein